MFDVQLNAYQAQNDKFQELINQSNEHFVLIKNQMHSLQVKTKKLEENNQEITHKIEKSSISVVDVLKEVDPF